MGVHASLSPAGAASAASFRKGQRVELVCTGSGETMTVATLDNCKTLDDYINGLSPSIQSRVVDFLSGQTSLGKANAGDRSHVHRRAPHARELPLYER
jgi:hypothetical protein